MIGVRVPEFVIRLDDVNDRCASTGSDRQLWILEFESEPADLIGKPVRPIPGILTRTRSISVRRGSETSLISSATVSPSVSTSDSSRTLSWMRAANRAPDRRDRLEHEVAFATIDGLTREHAHQPTHQRSVRVSPSPKRHRHTSSTAEKRTLPDPNLMDRSNGCRSPRRSQPQPGSPWSA